MDRDAIMSVLKGAAIAAAGALLTFLVDAAAGGALGPYGLILAPLLSVLMNAVRKYLYPDKPAPVPVPVPEPVKPPTPPGPWVAAILAVLLVGGSAWADLKITGEMKVPEHRIVRLTATGDIDGAALIWDLDREDVADVEEIGGRLLFAGPPGVYKVKLRAIRTKDGKTSAETARATVTVGSAPPVPPGPIPPVPPGPETPLVKDLRAAYQADLSPVKAQHLANLAAVYREVATKTNSADLKTAGDLLTVLRTAVASLVPADGLVAVRKRIAAEVSASLPTDPTVALDSPTRAKAAEVFSRVASSLEVIK